jgi:predicted RNA-binding protein YlqC (UPF0109 family)
MCNMKELVEHMAKSLVDDPDAVRVHEVQGAHATVFELMVAPDDKGRVIGKGGRVANAMRTVLHVAAIKKGKRVTLVIV